MKKKHSLEEICQALLCLPIPRIKAFVNLVMASCSHLDSKSFVGITSSPHCHYSYSNISKVSEYLSKDEENYEKIMKILLDFFLDVCSIPTYKSVELGNYFRFAQDMTMVDKSHSACLSGRVYGHQSNKNSIVSGYKVCCTHIDLGKSWSVPIKMDVFSPTDLVQTDSTLLAVYQLKYLLDATDLPFGDSFCVNSADSAYGNAKFLSPLYKYDKLVNVVRLRGGSKVYKAFSGEQKEKQNPKIYGQTYYLIDKTVTKTFKSKNKKTKEDIWTEKLQTSIIDCACDEFIEEPIVLGNGKKGVKKIWCWKNLLIRTKNKNSMKDKPFDLLKVEIWNEDKSKKIFDRDMFLSVNGQSKDKVSTQESYENYRGRFGVEPCYRFSKQHLFLGKFQTPDKQHFLNHLLIVFASWWVLYAAKDEIVLECPVWQKYLPVNKETEFTPSQVRKGISTLFHTFDKTPFLPQKCKKGRGRQAGTKMTRRERKNTYKKPKKEVIKE